MGRARKSGPPWPSAGAEPGLRECRHVLLRPRRRGDVVLGYAMAVTNARSVSVCLILGVLDREALRRAVLLNAIGKGRFAPLWDYQGGSVVW